MSDATLDKIHKEYQRIKTGADSETIDTEWNQACDNLIRQFESEGLKESAKFVAKYKVKK